MRTLTLHTADGKPLAADRADPAGEPRGGVVVCHPHPLYGGNRFHPVVDAVFRGAADAGLRAVRFDFRREHDGGVAERLDVVAALDALDGDGLALFVVGYSFGAVVALNVDDPRVTGIVAIAPPLAPGQVPPTRPALVLTPEYDQFCPPATAAPIVAGWPGATAEVVEGADHFLVGHSTGIAERTLTWLAAPDR